MKPYFLLLPITAIIFLFSCGNPSELPEPIINADSVYFEHEGWGESYYGMYRITPETLQEDTVGKRISTSQMFEYQHDEALHNSIEDILHDIPQSMINIEGRLFSNVTAHEPPTINIVAFCGEKTYGWGFIGIPDDLPDGTQEYIEKIKHLQQALLDTR